jgi:N-acetylglucosamine malate deacetylase 1
MSVSPEDSHLDVLAFGAHPDDVELNAGGTVARLARDGYRVGIVDLTRGELGSRGSVALRAREAAEASRRLGIHARENLGFADGDIASTAENRWRVIRTIRKYQPHVVLVGALECRHPDHPAATRLVCEAVFQSGLVKLDSQEAGEAQEPWRPSHVLHYMQALDFEPTFVVDVSDTWEQRTHALLAYASQFFSEDYPGGDEPETFISNSDFLRWVEARSISLGYRIGARHGEGFLYRHGPVGVGDLMDTLKRVAPR